MRDAFHGRRVAVTGGTSGLGLALVRELLARGAQVAFVARGREGIDRVLREHSVAHGIAGDVSRKDDILKATFYAVMMRRYAVPLDVLARAYVSRAPQHPIASTRF